MTQDDARPDLPVDAFDFELPEELIALRPARPRSSARLLVAEGPAIRDAVVADLPSILTPGDLLVFNDTRVLPVQLAGRRRRVGASDLEISATLIERLRPDSWRGFVKPGRRLRVDDEIGFPGGLSARVAEKGADGLVRFAFDREGAALDAAISEGGAMPLPPYIASRRAPDAQDHEDYQTVFAARDGAVAAPTAGLHFDAPLLAGLEAQGIAQTTVTLHVGPGTFLPVKAETTSGHRMHSEWGELSEAGASRITATKAAGGRVIAVGTTALRVLETVASQRGEIAPWQGWTDIFITPGYRFCAIDGLLTNFHLPRSTLFMLVSALMGLDHMRQIYAHAVDRRYRFFSFGDASLLLPATKQ